MNAEHRKIQRAHAMKRYRERYGVELTDFDYRALADRVFRFRFRANVTATNGVVPIAAAKAGRDLYFVRVSGSFVIAAWDERTMQISTFVPIAKPYPRVTGDAV